MRATEREIRRKKRILDHAVESGNVAKTCRYFGVPRSSFYRWRNAYQEHGEEGLRSKKSIAFVDHIVAKFPFRIQQIRTDRGHEFQAQFHWHVEDLGIRHAYIKARTPQLNGKVERSHRSDQEEFYQLLSYKGDVDLNKKLDEWEQF